MDLHRNDWPRLASFQLDPIFTYSSEDIFAHASGVNMVSWNFINIPKNPNDLFNVEIAKYMFLLIVALVFVHVDSQTKHVLLFTSTQNCAFCGSLCSESCALNNLSPARLLKSSQIWICPSLSSWQIMYVL